jgi:hypothetical protein
LRATFSKGFSANVGPRRGWRRHGFCRDYVVAGMAQKLVAVTAQIDLVDLAGLVAHRAVPATHCKGRTVLKS